MTNFDNKEALDLIQQGLNMLPEDIKRNFLGPVSQETGKGLGSIISLVSFPVNYLSIHANGKLKQLELKTQSKIEKKKKEGVYTEEKVGLAAKAIEESRYQLDSEILQDFFSELIANSLDKTYTDKITPYFSSVLSNMTEEEALFLRYMKYETGDALPLVNVRLNKEDNIEGITIRKNIILKNDNDFQDADLFLNTLQSTGLITIEPSAKLTNEKYTSLYESFENSSYYQDLKNEYQIQEMITHGLTLFEIEKGNLTITALGKLFIKLVVT